MADPLIPSREILWNVNSVTNVVVMYLLFGLSLLIAVAGILSRVMLWSSGKPAPELLGNWLQRFSDLYTWGFWQKGVVREWKQAVFHTLIYFGFLVLLFTTTMVLIHQDFGIPIYEGNFYLAVTLLSDVFGFGLLIGVLLAAHRRYIEKPDLLHNRWTDSLLLIVLGLLCLQGFILEGLRIHATNDPWRLYSPIGLLFAKLFWTLTEDGVRAFHFMMWWFHTITVFAAIAVLPYTKLFHIISSSANLYFRNRGRPKGRLESTGDIEKIMELGEEVTFGLGTIRDYSWKHLLDLDACTSCGRCQAVCPAYLANTPLSPKWIVLDTRNHMLALRAGGKFEAPSLPRPLKDIDESLLDSFLLQGSGVHSNPDGGFDAKGEFRASNPKVQQSVLRLGGSMEDRISGEVIDPMSFWSCTTCMACVQACPVGINHVDQIVGNRRNMVLMQGEIPHEAQPTLRALENRGNPYGAPEDRIKWAEGLELPILRAGDSVDYLYWVGCVSAYDTRKQKIARALVTLMKEAGLSFGVLGNAEGCTGDPARRLGEENLFQSLAKKNIELLKTVQFRNIVANCPHCFNTIRNEYPEFGNLGDGQQPKILHHSQLLRKLLDENKLKVKDSFQSYTFHDPCYLGRYNDEYEAPRATIGKVKGLKIIEMERTKEKGLCCGAGGGHFWMDLKAGDRINTIRVNEAAATSASKIASACPFCMQMLEDGVKLTNRENELQVQDIAEVILENLAEGFQS